MKGGAGHDQLGLLLGGKGCPPARAGGRRGAHRVTPNSYDARAFPRIGVGDPLWQDTLLEKFELPWLAEEGRLVR